MSTFNGSIIYADTYKDRSKLFRVDGEDGRRKQLTRDSRTDIHPSIDPFNWGRIVFSSRYALGFELRIIDTRGRFLETLTDESQGSAITSSWDPDGRYVAYSWIAGSTPQVRILDTVTGTNVFEAPDFGLAPTWSPWSQDGNSISIAYFNHEVLGPSQIWQINLSWNGTSFDGSVPIALTQWFVDDVNFDPPALIEQKVPAWSPDGQHIAFWQGVEAFDPRPTGVVPRDLWNMNADGTNQRLLVENSDDPFWSPDATDIGSPINIPLGPTTEPLAIGAVGPDGLGERTLFDTLGGFVRATWSI